jgi:hypothetical protein
MGPADDMTTITKDEPYLGVPRLAADGSNWIVFKIRLTLSMGARSVEGHLNGTAGFATVPKLSTTELVKWTAADEKAHVAYKALLEKWTHNESVARAQLGNVIGDPLLLKIYHCTSVADQWMKVKEEFEGKTCMVQVDLRRRMMEKRSEESDDMRVHLSASCTNNSPGWVRHPVLKTTPL